MDKTQLYPTPLHPLPALGRQLGVSIWCKRDDLSPISGGGNKQRKCERIFKQIEAMHHDAVITNGGTQSNHARVVALMAAQKGMRCWLVLHGHQDEMAAPVGNLLAMDLAGATCEITDANKIATCIASAHERLISEGLNPFVIEGGGHSVEGGIAYVEAVRELISQWPAGVNPPDYMVLASGTGTTQAGLVAGIKVEGWPTKVIGISVARARARGEKIVHEMASELGERLKIETSPRDIIFRDDWVAGGYGLVDAHVANCIKDVAKAEGLLLDPTYTAKAFLGLKNMILSGEIPARSTVLFWHTGGLLNLMSSNLNIYTK